MVKKMIGGFFLLLIFLVIFAPKEQIYYLLEKKLSKEEVVISNEIFHDNPFGFSIKDANIYFEGINIAKVKLIDLKMFFLYNEIDIESVKIDKGMQNILPESINKISAIYTVLNPNKVIIKGVGSFGEIQGYMDINEIFIRIVKPKKIGSLRQFLKKDKEGFYYEKSFR
jgi:hypothetical protein